MNKTFLICLFISFSAYAQSGDKTQPAACNVTEPDPENCFKAEAYDSGGSEIQKYLCDKTEVRIPCLINGVKVTAIESGAFMDKRLTSVTLPNTVTTISTAAFKNNKLSSIVFPASVVNFYPNSFESNQLKFIQFLAPRVSVMREAFKDNLLTEVVFPDGGAEIGERAFTLNRITRVRLPLMNVRIGAEAFFSNKLTSLFVPEGVLQIGDFAFAGNEIATLELKNGLKEIGRYAFSNNKLTRVEIPESVIQIGPNAFEKNLLTHVTLPATSVTVDAYAFALNQIASVTIPASVHLKGVNIFLGNPLPPHSVGGSPILEPKPFTPIEGPNWGIQAVKARTAWSSSNYGAGIRVAIIDSGIDVNHPAIKDNFEKGINFTSDDPEDIYDRDGHGTHVAATAVGALNSKTGFSGVAPRSRLFVARACDGGDCSDEDVANGIQWAIEQKVHVINLSLGSVNKDDESLNNAIQKAEDHGIMIVSTAGNHALHEYYTTEASPNCYPGSYWACGINFPASHPLVVGVGSVDQNLGKTPMSMWGKDLDLSAPGGEIVSAVPIGRNDVSVAEIEMDNVKTKISSITTGAKMYIDPRVEGELILMPGFGEAKDFAKVDVKGKVILVARSNQVRANIAQMAKDAGALGMVGYDIDDDFIYNTMNQQPGITEVILNHPAISIDKARGIGLAHLLRQSKKIKIKFSSRKNDYTFMTGTSMAAPHVTGVIALMIAANKDLSPAQVREILRATARPLGPNDQNQYGAGLVQADAAVKKAIEYKSKK